MKFLLTSSGIKNQSIQQELVDLLGKPIEESTILCVPTGIYPFHGGSQIAYRFLTGRSASPALELGWRSLGVLELTALPSLPKEVWSTTVSEADALLVFGGDVFFLENWLRRSGLAELLPSFEKLVYVGISAGSMAVGSLIGETFNDPEQPFVIQDGIGLVEFALLPHLDHIDHPESSLEKVEKLAASLTIPFYAIDDETAISVANGNIRVVSAGHWKLFNPTGNPA